MKSNSKDRLKVVNGNLLIFDKTTPLVTNDNTDEKNTPTIPAEKLALLLENFKKEHPDLALLDDMENGARLDNYIGLNGCLITNEKKAQVYEVGIPTSNQTNIPKRRGFNFYIIGDCKLSQVLSNLPYGILNKNKTGIGATTLELNANRNSIIVVPTKNLAYNKAQTGQGKYLYVGSTINGKANSGSTQKDIIKYITNRSIHPKKIITVADSLKKVLNALDYLKIDRNDYFLTVDEVDIIQSDSTFRPKLENVIDYYFTFNKEHRCLLSATMGEFSHPEVRKEPLIEIEFQIPAKRTINLCRTDNPDQLVHDLIQALEESGKIVIAYNSLTQIQIIIELLQAYAIKDIKHKEEQKRVKQEIKNKCGILCSDASRYKVKEFYQELAVNENNQVLLPRKINFMTCAFFVGLDINEPFHLISVSNIFVPYTLLSPNKYTQIAGRGRKGLLSEYIVFNTYDNKHSNERFNIESYRNDLIEKAKEIETLYAATKAICKRNSTIIPMCNKVNNAIQSAATENIEGIAPIPLTYQDINGDYKVSYFNIDALCEKKQLKNELYATPDALEKALNKEGHHVIFTYNEIPYSNIQKLVAKNVGEENNESLKENMETAISELIKLDNENTLSDAILQEHINHCNMDMKTLYERVLSLYKYINLEILISKLVKDENTLKGIDKDQYEQLYQSIILWALDDNHNFKKVMKDTFLQEDKRFTPELIKNNMERIYSDFGLPHSKTTSVTLFRKFFKTTENNDKNGIGRYFLVKGLLIDSLKAEHKEIIPDNADITSLFKV